MFMRASHPLSNLSSKCTILNSTRDLPMLNVCFLRLRLSLFKRKILQKRKTVRVEFGESWKVG